MDRNLLLAFALSFAVLTLWTMWQEDNYGPGGGLSQQEAVQGASGGSEPRSSSGQMAEGEPRRPISPEPGPSSPVQATRADEVFEEEILEIRRNRYRLELTNRGAGVRRWILEDFTDKLGDPIVFTTGEPPHATALLTPLVELGLGDLSRARFQLESDDGDRVVYRLERNGVVIRKIFSFPEDGYEYSLGIEIENGAGVGIVPQFGVAWPIHAQPAADFKEQGYVVYRDGSVERELLAGVGGSGFLGMGATPPTVEYPGNVEWAGVETTYFVGMLLPDDPSNAQARIATWEPSRAGRIQVGFSPIQIPAGQRVLREFRGYVGPKETKRLEELGSGALQAIDLGWSWVAPMTRFFNWLLQSLYQLVPNYGFAIILLTALVRVVTAPLTIRQMRSMERMRALQPQLKEIQEKFADDRQKQSEKTMELYRKEKVNPLGGCLPMLLQLPVFIGLFYALRSSISLRQAPFIGWIHDLSTPESIFTIPGLDLPIRVLPIVMGATMVIQQRMTPMPSVDPAQARMMQTVMPIMMTVLFYQFASGLVLYWMVSNILAIAHQRWIGRNLQQA
ncbi:membrane protein insertase YidC [Myxococcota bacterium]|nr:membrane protein insertase YidC [Myxococcota bacterium]